MLPEIFGLRRRGQRIKGSRLVRKLQLESLENRRLMYGANALAWNIMEPGALPGDAVAVGHVGDSLNTSAFQVGEELCSSQAPLDPTAVAVRLVRRQYLASDQNTVVGESLCIPARNVESDNPESGLAQISSNQLVKLMPPGQVAADQTAHATALSNRPGDVLSHSVVSQVGQVQGNGPVSESAVAAGLEPSTGSTSSSQSPQAAASQVVTIALKRRVRVVPPASSGTSGNGANTSGGATTPGSSAADNAPVTLPLNNQGGSLGGSGQNENADSGTALPLSQIPNVLNLPASSRPVSTGDSPTPSDNTSQPADPSPTETTAAIGLGRLLLNAAGSGQAGSSSTGASSAGNPTAGASTALPGTWRSLLTSAGQSTSGGSAASSLSWPELVDAALTAPPVDATPACLRTEFCLLRL